MRRVTDAELAGLPAHVRAYVDGLERENSAYAAEVKRLGRENDEMCDRLYEAEQALKKEKAA